MPASERPPLAIVADCTDAALDPGNPGVIRTARRLGRELAANPAFQTIFALWDRTTRAYRPLAADERRRLASHGGPDADGAALGLLPGPDTQAVLLLLEAPMDGQMPERLLWAYARRFRVAAILYDAIPLSHPQLCVPSIVANFPEYLRGIACVDAAFAISQYTMAQFETYLDRGDLPRPRRRAVAWLPAQFSDTPRQREDASAPLGSLRLISVGSIEPRKNQLRLIDAFAALRRRRPDLDIELTLVGNRFAGAAALAERVEAMAARTPGLQWIGAVDDGVLAGLYRASSMSVYPSLVEGFGLPILESLWLGRPCLCHAGGVMQELAAGGGCLTADMTDQRAIEQALETLATTPDDVLRLAREAEMRELKTWREFGREIAAALIELDGA